MRCAVVGHVEWVEFAIVPHLPEPGEIVAASDTWSVTGGGGAVIARQVERLAGNCTFFTSLADDEIGRENERELRALGLDVRVQHPGEAESRRAWTHVDGAGERTITVLGEKLRPRGPLPLGEFELVVFVAGDAEALRSARAARFVAATTREQPTLNEAGVSLDLLVGSLNDPAERYEGGLDAAVVALTDRGHGGTANGERFSAAPLPGPIVDTYGAGDSFAGALAVALARGDELHDALALAARAGAAVITGRGPYSTQIEA